MNTTMRTADSKTNETREGGAPTSAVRWLRVDDAARLLGLTTVTLRRTIERNARRDAAGRVHASFDGIRARKLGRNWRVLLDDCWTPPGVG
jgi:hypothetical protein